MTPITSRIILTIFVLLLIANVRGIAAIYMKNDRNRPAKKGAVSVLRWE